MGQPTPDELAIPDTAIRPTRKEKAELVEALNHSIGAVFLLEQFEERPDGALHFLVGIENDLVAVKYQPTGNGKRNSPFCALLSLAPWRRARMMCSSACANVPFMPRTRLSLKSDGS